MVPLVLNLGTKWTVNFTLRPLYHRGRRPLYLMNWRLRRPHSWFGRFCRKGKSLTPAGYRIKISFPPLLYEQKLAFAA